MAGDELKVSVKFDAGKAVKQIDQLAKKAKDAGESFEDLEVNAKNVARVMGAQADSMIADMKASEKAAEALADALGPEMAGRIGNAKIDELIADVRRAGIEFDDLTANADEFAAVLRKLDSAADSVDDVDRAMARVGNTSEKSRDVMHSFTGNALAEIPGVTETFGPMGEAISQMTEGLLAGEVGMKALLAAAGPMAAVAAGIMLVSKVIESNNKATEQAKKLQEQLVDAYDESRQAGTDVADEIAKAWRDGGGKAEVAITMLDRAFWRNHQRQKQGLGEMQQNWDDTSQEIVNMNDVLLSLGMTAGEFLNLAGQSSDEIAAFGDALLEQGVSAETTAQLINGLYAQHQNLAEAEKVSAAKAKVFAGAIDEVSSAHTALITKYKLAKDAADKAEQALSDYHDTMRSSVDASFAVFDAQNDLTQALEDAAGATDDSTTAVDEVAIAQSSAAESAFRLADANVAQAEAQAKANGQTLTAAQRNDLLVGSLQATANQLAPDSPLRKQLELYIAALKRVPPNIATALSITAGTASRAGLLGQSGPYHASGTSSAPGGVTLVGEQGPELVNMPRGAEVLSAGMTQAALRGGGGATQAVINNITINTAADPKSVVEAIKRYTRGGGVL